MAKKKIADCLDNILNLEVVDVEILDVLNKMGMRGKLTIKDAISCAQVVKAIRGDSQAFQLVRDTIGEKPIEKNEMLGGDVRILIDGRILGGKGGAISAPESVKLPEKSE